MAGAGGGGLRGAVKARLLGEMLGAGRAGKGAGSTFEETGEWRVLVLDAVTTRVLSAACRMSDLNDLGVSLVEDLNKGRQPIPGQDAIYYITPTEQSVGRLVQDWSRKRPLYRGAHVFFSSALDRKLLARIKDCAGLIAGLRSLKEANLEFEAIDMNAFTTGHPHALRRLFGEGSGGAEYNAELEAIVARLTTLFSSLKEFPSIRFHAPTPQEEDSLPGAQNRALMPQRVAAMLHKSLTDMQGLNSELLPTSETCDLLIVDRSVDPVAPIIHEWTYEAMAHDLLAIANNVYSYSVDTNAGETETHDVLLDENDTVWVELRHKHIAEASTRLNEDMANFTRGNKLASARKREGSVDMKDLKGMVESLPQYRDRLRKLALHIDIATTLINMIKAEALEDVGKLEQDLVYGNATSKELIKLLGSEGRSGMTSEDKVRLLMCYVATHPEKLDNHKRLQWMKLAKLTAHDMNAVNNLEYLGVAVSKRQKSAMSFGKKSKKRAIRKERNIGEDEEQWQLSRFQPHVLGLVEDVAKGTLSTDEYPYVLPPSSGAALPVDTAFADLSVRRKGGAAASWARKGKADGGAKDHKKLIIFVIGGITRSEIRVAHKMSHLLERNVIVGGTSVDNPHQFIEKLQSLSGLDLDLDL